LLRADIDKHPASQDQPGQLELLGKLIDVPPAFDPERYLEIVLLQAAGAQALPAPAATAPASEPIKEPVKELAEESKAPPLKAPTPTKPAGSIPNEDLWPAVLQALKQKHNTLYGIVRMAKPSFPNENTLQLTFGFAFHQKKLNEAANRQLLLDTIEQLSGRQLTVECLLDTDRSSAAPQTSQTTTLPPDDSLSTINNIFSGAELLES
jgi:hypothetical protein